MENKQVNKNVNNETVTNLTETTPVVESKEIITNKKVYLKREHFTGSDGKTYWSYLIRGKLGSRDVKSDFMPKDKGGFEVLDIIYSMSDQVELVMSEETMTDPNTGKRSKYMVYKARFVNEDGVVFECDIKPAQSSDKSLLQMLLSVGVIA